MRFTQLVAQSLRHYWRTNLAVVAGVATAVTVLAGALLVGDSVRGSLRDLVLQRLGRTDLVIVSSDFFRAELADAIRLDPSFEDDFRDIVPLIAVPGVATQQESGRRASRVTVYGVDERFWAFHGLPPKMADFTAGSREVLLSEALAREIGASPASTVLLRVQRPSDIPLESLHGRKDDVGRTIRLTVREVLTAAGLGEFSLQPQQGEVRAAFVPLARLRQDLEVNSRVNTLLISTNGGPERPALRPILEALLRRHAALEDVGLKLRMLEGPPNRQGYDGPPEGGHYLRQISLESIGALIDEPREQAALAVARDLDLPATPVMTYLANSMRAGDRVVPYSLVTAIELTTLVPDLVSNDSDLPPIVLNEWAARDLGVKPGDRVTLDYYVWEDPGRLNTRSSSFRLATIVPLAGPFADRDFAPDYPGITDSESLRDWDPPFPIDLGQIREIDEEYWRLHRTTPKAFVPEPFGRAFWSSRYGSLTSIRLAVPDATRVAEALDEFASRLRAAIDPMALGLVVRDTRAEGLAASRGATDFGEYFAYFSFFLVVSAVMLAALFFKLGVEQRVREVGLLRAVGFTTPAVRRLFASEALVLAVVGSAIGVIAAIGYAQLMMTGLRTWWVDAVGTTALTLHVTAASLIAGAVAGIVAALVCVWWTLRSLARVSERSLLAGEFGDPERVGPHRSDDPESIVPQLSDDPKRVVPRQSARFSGVARPFQGRSDRIAVAFLALGLLLLTAGTVEWLGRAGAFFGAGASLLSACLFAAAFWLGQPPRTTLGGHGWWSMSRLGMRNASYRPARSVLSIAVMAAATFILISVGAFRRDGAIDSSNTRSGTGGYTLVIETVIPIVHDPNSPEGREQLGLVSGENLRVEPFRLLPGDDASCLNLYEPREPRVLGVGREFTAEGRFAFAGSLDGAERENPWLLLHREYDEGAIPVIADANSMTYVLHKSLGDDIVINRGGREIRLRFVAALSDSIFQGELLMSEANFVKSFPDQEGYSVLLVAAPLDRVHDIATAIEDRLSDLGADAVATADKLAGFHRVENTYLSTFQTLGGLGLLLGTIGLAAVLLRNVLERRRELALLGAVGYGRDRLFVIVIAESALLLACGLLAGTVCAVIAIIPAAAEHGGRVPVDAGAWLLLFAVFATGLVSSIVAARAAMASRLLDGLRNE